MVGQMKESGVEWIGEIPEEWETKKLKYCCSLIVDKIPADSENNEDLMFVGMEHVESQKGGFGSSYEPIYDFQGEGIRFAKGDVLFGKLRPYLAKVLLAEDNGKCSSEFFVLRAQPNIVPDFLKFGILSKGFIDYVDSTTFGVKMPRANWELVGNTRFMSPDASKQLKIVAYLNEKCSEIDTVIAAKQKQNELLKKQRQSIIDETVTKGLDKTVKYQDSEVEWIGEIPDKWSVKRLKYLLLQGNEGIRIGPFGSSLKLDDTVENGEYKVYGQENLINSDFKVGKRYIDEIKYQELSNYSIFSGDILISMMGTIGKCEVVPQGIQKGIMDSHLTRIRGDERLINNEFLALLISDSCYIQTQFDIQSKGSIMNGLNSSIVKELIIALPTIIEQQLICNYLKNRCSEIDRVIQSNTAIIGKLKDYRQSIIYEAVTGKIAV